MSDLRYALYQIYERARWARQAGSNLDARRSQSDVEPLLDAVQAVAKVAERLDQLSELPIGDAGTRVARAEAAMWIRAALEDKLIGDDDEQ